MSPPIRSEVWVFFKLDAYDQDKAKCKICNKTYSRKGRTTSSLKNHLKSVHPEEYNLFETLDKEKKLQEIKVDRDEIVAPMQETEQQLFVEELIVKEEKLDTDYFDSKKIDKLIGEMIALQNLPFHFVDGVGFRRLIQELAPRYNFRERIFWPDFVCKELYGKLAKKTQELIRKFDYMSFTSEIMSDPITNVSLLNLSCHGITENFDRSSIVLKSEIIGDCHGGDIVTEKFDAMLSEWNIKEEQVHCLTRDEGSNIKGIMRLAAFNDMDCTINKMQHVIRNCLNSQGNIKIVKEKCENISTHFKHSTDAQKQLQKIQDSLSQPHHKVFRDCTTRWNSTFYMFERFLRVKDALSFYTNNSEIDPILPEEWKIIHCCITLLKPFEEATQELSKPDALISSVIPITQILGKKLADYSTRSFDFDPIRLAVTTLKTEFCAKFSTLLEANNFYVIATYLDPRYKHKFLTPVTVKKIKEDILKMRNIEDDVLRSPERAKRMRTRYFPEKYTGQPGTSSTVRNQCLEDDLAMILDSSSEEECQNNLENCSADVVLKKELLSYKNKKRANINENPLKWWSVYRKELKIMSQIARRFLSPPPVSLPCEQLFNSAGSSYEPLLNKIEPDKIARLLFIKYNAPIFNFTY